MGKLTKKRNLPLDFVILPTKDVIRSSTFTVNYDGKDYFRVHCDGVSSQLP